MTNQPPAIYPLPFPSAFFSFCAFLLDVNVRFCRAKAHTCMHAWGYQRSLRAYYYYYYQMIQEKENPGNHNGDRFTAGNLKEGISINQSNDSISPPFFHLSKNGVGFIFAFALLCFA